MGIEEKKTVEFDVTADVSELTKSLKEANVETEKLEKDLKDVEKQSEKTSKTGSESVSKWGKAFQGLKDNIVSIASGYFLVSKAISFVSGLWNKATDYVKNSVLAYNEQKQAVKEAEFQFGTYAKQIIALGNEVQKATKYGDDYVVGLANQAKQMGVNNNQIESVIKGALGLEAVFKMSADTGVRLYSKALASGNYEMLGRYIPALKQTKDKTEQLAIINKFMADTYEIAQMKAKSSIGTYEQLENKLGDIAELVGGYLDPVFKDFVVIGNKLADTILNLSSKAETEAQSFEYLSAKYQVLAENTNRSNIQQEEFLEVIKELKLQYPEHLANMDLELGSREAINIALEKQRNLTIRNIALEKSKAELEKIGQKQIDVTHELTKAQTALKIVREKSVDSAIRTNATMQGSYAELSRSMSAGTYTQRMKDDEIKALNDLIAGYQKSISAFQEEAKKATAEWEKTLETFVQAGGKTKEINSLQTEINELGARMVELGRIDLGKSMEKDITDLGNAFKAGQLPLTEYEKKVSEIASSYKKSISGMQTATEKQTAKNVAYLKSMKDVSDSYDKIAQDGLKVAQAYEEEKISITELNEETKKLRERTKALDEAKEKAIATDLEYAESLNNIESAMYGVSAGMTTVQKEASQLVQDFKDGIITSEEFAEGVKKIKQELSNVKFTFKMDIEKPQAVEEDLDLGLPDEVLIRKKLKENYEMEKAYLDEHKTELYATEEAYLIAVKELQDKYDQEEWAKKEEKQADYIALIDQTQSAVFGTVQAWTNRDIAKIEERYSKEKDELNALFDSGEILREEYDDRMKKLDNKAELEKRKILKRQQSWDVGSAVANSALAITKVFASTPPPFSFILAALTAVQTALQVQTILAQKFKDGGLALGATHEEGGIPAIIDGTKPAEIENEEIIQTAGVYKDPPYRDLANFTNEGKGGRYIPNSRRLKSVAMQYQDGSIFNLKGRIGSAKPLSSYFADGGLAGSASLNSITPSGAGFSTAQLDYIASKLSINVSSEAEISMDKLAYKISVKQNKMKEAGYNMDNLG